MNKAFQASAQDPAGKISRQAAVWVAAALLLSIAAAALAWWYLTPGNISTALARGQYSYAAQKLESEVGSGNTVVLTTLANLYFMGLGVGQSHKRSAQLYSEAAFAGNLAAQINLGHLYSNGLGVAEDTKMAYAWFNLARNNGSKIAQLYMSDLLAEQRLRAHHVVGIRRQYATLANFPRLHQPVEAQ